MSSLEALTQREQEIVACLLDGGRVAGVARELFVSEHTVRAHLKSIFGKVGVHSQAELIARARENPELAGRSRDTPDPQRILRAQTELVQRLRQIVQAEPTVRGLKLATRAVLPADAEGRKDWRDRIAAWSDRDVDEAVREQRDQARANMWNLVDAFVGDEGRVSLVDDQDPHGFAQSLSALMIGAAVRLAREDDPTELERELHTLDAFVDTNCFDRSG